MSDMEWLAQLHRENYESLLRLARHRLRQSLRDDSEADDVVQEAFTLAAAKDIRSHANPRAWLFKTVDHLCRRCVTRSIRTAQKHQRAAQRQAEATSLTPETDRLLGLELLARMRQELTEEDWTLLRRCCLEGQSPQEVAAQMGLTVNNLRVRLHRIRKKLKKSMYDL